MCKKLAALGYCPPLVLGRPRRLNLQINIDTMWAEVLEEVVSCIPHGCVSVTASYHHEKSLSLSLRGLSSTVVTIEPFEEGTAITTTTLEHIAAPLEQ